MSTYIEELRDVIKRLHGADASHVETVPVKESWFWPWSCGNSYFRYPCLKKFFHTCLITNDLKVANA